jgi:hypothetical protein
MQSPLDVLGRLPKQRAVSLTTAYIYHTRAASILPTEHHQQLETSTSTFYSTKLTHVQALPEPPT